MPNFRRRYEQSNIYLPYRTFTHTIRWSIYVRNALQSTRIALTQHYWHTVTQSSQTDWPMNNWHNSDQPHTQTSQLGGHQHSHGTPPQKKTFKCPRYHFSQVLWAHLVRDDVTPDRPCTRLASSDTRLRRRLLVRLNSRFFIRSRVVEPRRRDTGLPPTVGRREGVPAERQEARKLRTQDWSTSQRLFFKLTSFRKHEKATWKRQRTPNTHNPRPITGVTYRLSIHSLR